MRRATKTSRRSDAARTFLFLATTGLTTFACSSSISGGAYTEPGGFEFEGGTAPCDCSPPSGSGGGPGTGAASEGAGCVTSVDCAGGLECGYDPAGGCTAGGTCVAQVSGPEAPAACGCDGLPVQYVAPQFTSQPVASALPCGWDAGAADAATLTDASDAGDLSDAEEHADANKAGDAGDAGALIDASGDAGALVDASDDAG
jgi:hypothetical protein